MRCRVEGDAIGIERRKAIVTVFVDRRIRADARQ